jgi:hypothetical protein
MSLAQQVFASFFLMNYWLRVAWRTPPDSGNLALS